MATASIKLPDQLQHHFGWTYFRPGQQDVIETVLAGRDCLCVMPTGGGKSLCYQLPALVQPGTALVVSPLIALMKDQVDQLLTRRMRATYINSSLELGEQRARIAQMLAGEFDLVYVAPERFRSPRFCEALEKTALSLLAVDEAHCISEWGHDFRPDYLRLGKVRKQLGNPVTIALTATATGRVRDDIVKQLSLHEPRVFITGFDRPNLTYECLRTAGNAEKQGRLRDWLEQAPGSGIIYAATRKRCEEVAELVQHACRRRCVVYHGGMLSHERRQAQEAFMADRSEIAVATNAFGMGIDKPDIRFVVHYNLPGTIEAYYQEAGRSGRDGKPARCLLLYAPSDRYIQEFFIENEYPSRQVVGEIHRFLCARRDEPIQLTQQQIKEELALDVGDSAVGVSLRLLQSAGVLERLQPNENMAWVRIATNGETLTGRLSPNAQVRRRVLLALEELVAGSASEAGYFHPERLARELDLDREALQRALRWLKENLPVEYVPPFRGQAVRMLERSRPFDELPIDFAELERRKAAEYDKLEQVITYAKLRACRREALLRYFGDASKVQCGNCDNCTSGRAAAAPPWEVNDQTITHSDSQGAQTADAADPDATPPHAQRLTEFLQKVLSGVARANGRVGKNVVAAMLTGSNSKKVQRPGLQKLSTFGLLSDFTQPEVAQTIDLAIDAGYVEQEEVERFRPIVKITPDGRDVMAGERPPAALALPDDLFAKISGRPSPSKVPAAPTTAPSAGRPVDQTLLQQLRQLRDRWAQNARLPLHYILTNETMDELARLRPQDEEQLLAIKGIGPKKIERYGRELLALFQTGSPAPASEAPTHSTPASPPPHDRDSKQAAAPPAATTDQTDHPTHYWTWRLLERGFKPDECASIRNLEPGDVAAHALAAARAGRTVDLRWLLSETQIDVLERTLAAAPTQTINDLRAALPPEIRHEHVQLYLTVTENSIELREQSDAPD